MIDENSGGVYAIINMKDGKNTTYIGATIQTFKHRWACHLSELHYNRHPNKYLQNAWNYYGKEAFTFIVLEKIDNYTTLLEHEQIWLDFYRIYVPIYNINLIVDQNPMYGKEVSKEHRQKISKALIGGGGWKHSKETKERYSRMRRGKPPTEGWVERMVCIHEKTYPSFRNKDTGEVIPMGVNLAQLCRERNLNPGNMCEVKNGNRKSHKGWVINVEE